MDNLWSGITNSAGQTLRDTLTSQLERFIGSQIGSKPSLSLPTTGALQAAVVGDSLYLSFQLKGNSVNISVQEHILFFTITLNYNITSDIEIFITITIPSQAGPLASNVVVQAENANVSAGNFGTSLVDFVLGIASLLSGRSFNIFQSAENSINSQSMPIPQTDLGDISTALSYITQVWENGQPYGLTILAALIQQGQVILQLEHPLDPPPIVYPIVNPTGPSLIVSSISVSSLEVDAGSSVVVNGTGFPLAANAIWIGWIDTTSGTVLGSQVTYFMGPNPPVSNPPISGVSSPSSVSRNGSHDGNNQFVQGYLDYNAAYYFQVRDEDYLTYTLWSVPTPFITGGSDTVDLVLQSTNGGAQIPIGAGSLGLSPSFAATVVIPPSQTPGTYNILALWSGITLGTAEIIILAPGSEPIPTILVDLELPFDTPFVITFAGFLPGVVTVYIDTPSQTLPSVTSTSTATFLATFTWPQLAAYHTIYAQGVAGQPVASAKVYGMPPPQ